MIIIELQIRRNNSKYWYMNGNNHRDGDHPAILYRDGTKSYYMNDQLIREVDGTGEIFYA
jgi:hypothetical protein